MTVIECPVCLENLFDLCVVETPCQHRFCLHCFVKWLKPECPMCRRSFSKKEIPADITDMFTKNQGSPTGNVRSQGARGHVAPPQPLPQQGRPHNIPNIPNVSSVLEFPFLS
jgi:hypothetical protein